MSKENIKPIIQEIEYGKINIHLDKIMNSNMQCPICGSTNNIILENNSQKILKIFLHIN